ncbi:MAG TPA: class I SAM-dependent methyltransferase [Candidatus Angelobacter sp.]|nr:class I SAM-dependent methyltransferase [Candidatus Angelobacter sp.]
MVEHDIWSKWLLESRFGKQPDLTYLKSLRDKVLENAKLTGTETVLDVGAGDGLIAFGALEHLGPSGRVILTDISPPLLEQACSIAERMNVLDQCQFVQASADDLSCCPDDSIDVVTTRSVLIYVSDKLRAMREFYRVLKRGGRISLFETVTLPQLRRHDEKWAGVGTSVYPAKDLEPISDLVTRFISGLDFVATKSMETTDHIGYLHLCEQAGFTAADVELHLATRKRRIDLDTLLSQSLNPHFPTPAEHIEKIFTPAERERFITHLKTLIETGAGISRSSNVFIRATKPGCHDR